MMAHKHLHEILKEDQEPFDIKSFIADKRGELNKRSVNGGPNTTLQVKKRKPMETSTFYKHACFLSFHDSPDIRKSPFRGFPSPAPSAKSPCKTQSRGVLFHVPARTAASLLEAAMRVQKQNTTQIKNVGFGLFGSILRRLKDRSKSKKREINAYEVDEGRRNAYEMSVSCSYDKSRVSSNGWSESMDKESCSSSEDSVDDAFAEYEKLFCSTPLSPFRFALHKCSSPGVRTPEFSSPVASPGRRYIEEKEKNEVEGLINNQLEEDEEKEQFSPVSILDNPFDDDGNEGGDELDYEDDYELNCSYANVQRSKQQLLYKLCRFEKLAELDPIELEKRMVEQIDEQDHKENQLKEEIYEDTFINKVLSKLGFENSENISADMKRLLSDLISEENREIDGFNNEEKVINRVCKKLDSWKEVEYNTIDMMVQSDFIRDFDVWRKYQEQTREIAMEIELEIFKLLMEELSEDLVC